MLFSPLSFWENAIAVLNFYQSVKFCGKPLFFLALT